MSELDDVIQEFLVESYENLDQLDRDLVDLEESPDSTETIASIFRTIHTIKGTCGFLGYGKLEKVTHTGENLLSMLRDGKWTINTPITDALLAMVDAVREMLGQIETTQTEGDADYSVLVARLAELQETGGLDVASPESLEDDSSPHATVELVEQAAADVARTVDLAEAAPPPEAAPPTPRASAAETAIRVDVGLLDTLMNLVGELVLTRNQILQCTTEPSNPTLASATQRLNVLTSELQENVMKTRMQPIGKIWSKFPRVVRDLANQCGKQVRLDMEGKDTELDKSLIEAIKDPLTHLVRNAVDHGIEEPAVREAAGKPAEGVMTLRAYHEGGLVNIEISDDGGGIDPVAVKAKAVANGSITQEQADAMGDRDAANLIFRAGLSTAKAVTNVSGRGVGMDVVRTNIERIGGSIEIQSAHGQGTAFRIKIPLTLAIIPAQIVAAGGSRYAIPQVSILELLRLEGPAATQEIESIHGTPVYRLRGNLLPLVDLDEQLGLPRRELDPRNPALNIIVLQADEHPFGLIVDSITDTEEIVVKPLGNELKNLSVFAGATIMGDGTVALILDVLGLAQCAHVVGDLRERGAVTHQAREAALRDSERILLFAVGETGRFAMPLGEVARLEEFPRNAVEKAGTRDVVQYRGELLPLLSIGPVIGGGSPRIHEPTEPVSVVVYSRKGRNVGLVVDEILDIVQDEIESRRDSDRPGLAGSGVIGGRVTDLIDPEGVIRAVYPEFFQDREAALA